MAGFVPGRLDDGGSYPKPQRYNQGGQTIGTQGSQTRRMVSSRGKGSFGRRIASEVGRSLLTGATAAGAAYVESKLNERYGGKSRGQKTALRAKKGSDGESNPTGKNKSGGSGRGSDLGNTGAGYRGGGDRTPGYTEREGVPRLHFDSGVRSGLVVNSRGRISTYSSMYLSSGWLFRTTDDRFYTKSGDYLPDTQFITQLKEVFYPMYEQIISNRINRYAGDFINADLFAIYWYDLLQALQIYYCIDDVLAYTSNNSNDNINFGMESLRNHISASVVVEYNLLREALENVVCPPNIVEYIRFMCQSYRQSDAPHASLIKLNIGGLFDENVIGNDISTGLDVALRGARFNIIKNSKVWSYLSRAFPDQIIGNLPPSTNEAHFDLNFWTFWHNQNSCYQTQGSDGDTPAFKYSRQADNTSSYLPYHIFERDEDVDGMIYCTVSSFLTDSGVIPVKTYWGIWQPLASMAGKEQIPNDLKETFSLRYINEHGQCMALHGEHKRGNSGVYSQATMVPGSKIAWITSSFGSPGFVYVENSTVRTQAEAFNNSMRLLFNPS